ncbi:hypothetical protein CCH79_00008845, partial [Gambusia affinis]
LIINEEFMYLGILFTNGGRREWEINRRIGAASAVKRALYRSVVVKRELSQKAKLSIYRSIYDPPLIYGHELWVMTEKTRSRIQAAEMGFLRRVAGLFLRDRVRSSDIREGLRVEPLLLYVERSQLRWLGHLVRMPPGRLPGEAFRARPTGRRPRGRPRTRWRDYVSRLAWERLGIPPEELVEVDGEREVWASLLKLLPRDPTPDKRKKMDGWMDGYYKCTLNRVFLQNTWSMDKEFTVNEKLNHPEDNGKISFKMFSKKLLHLPPLLIKKLMSSTYSEAIHQNRVTLQGYHSNHNRQHPLLGLQHIVECVSSEPGEALYYLCTLCQLLIPSHTIIGHLLSFDHVHSFEKPGIRHKEMLNRHHQASAPSTKEVKCMVHCQNCSKGFSNMFRYLEHLASKEHIRVRKFYVHLYTYINECLKTNMPPVGTSLVMTCLTSVSKDDPFYLCIACQDFFYQSDVQNHFESRKHLISTQLYVNPWLLPFAWEEDLDDRALRWTAWKEGQNRGQIFLKIFDVPYSVFHCLDSQYEEVFHSLQVQYRGFMHKVPQSKTYSKDKQNEQFPLLGQGFLVLHYVGVAPNEVEVGCLCLLCERRVYKEEIEAHVFSREHVSTFLDCFHPDSLTSCTVDAETLLDLAKQAATLHSPSCMQMILTNAKWTTDNENLVPPINPMRKLVPRIPPKHISKQQKTDDQKTCTVTDTKGKEQSSGKEALSRETEAAAEKEGCQKVCLKDLENERETVLSVKLSTEEATTENPKETVVESHKNTEENNSALTKPEGSSRIKPEATQQQKNERKRSMTPDETGGNGSKMSPKRQRLSSNESCFEESTKMSPESGTKVISTNAADKEEDHKKTKTASTTSKTSTPQSQTGSVTPKSKTPSKEICSAASSSDPGSAATLKPEQPLKSKDPAAPKTKEASSATSEMAKAQVINLNAKSSVNTLTRGNPDSETAAHKRKPPASLHQKPEEIKKVRNDLPHVASSKTTLGGNFPKVGKNYLVVVSCEQKQQVYCLLCSVRLIASSHLMDSVHQYKYVKLKYPEWPGNEKMENELNRIVHKLANVDKELPHTQIFQRLEVKKDTYQTLGQLPDHLAIETVKTLVKQRDLKPSSSPSVDNTERPSKDISSPCDVSSSGIPVFHDEMSDAADGHQLWASLDQASEMECVDEDVLSAGQSFSEKSSDEEDLQVDEEIQVVAETMQTQDPQQVLDQCAQAEDTAETILKSAESCCPAELQRHQRSSGEDLEAQNLIQEHQPSMTDKSINPNPVPDDEAEDVAETPQLNRLKVQDDGRSHRKVTLVVAGQHNQSGHKAEPAPMLHLRSEEHRSSQANSTTLTGKIFPRSSDLHIFLTASNQDPNKVAGRAYVWECHSSYQKTFLCEACEEMLSSRDICQHMVSLDHQLNYLRKEDQRFLDMFWLQDDLPLDFKNQVLMDVIQALSKREKALNVEPKFIWLTPELHKVLLATPFSKALEILKSIRDEDLRVFHPSAYAGHQTSERHKNGQQTAGPQSIQESFPANCMSAQILEKDQRREMANQNPDKAQPKEPTLAGSFAAVGSGRTSRMDVIFSSSKTDHAVLPDPNVCAQNLRPLEVNPPNLKVDPVVPSSSTAVALSLEPCSSSLQPHDTSSVSQVEGSPRPQELNVPYSKHNLVVPSCPPNPNLNTSSGGPLQPGFNPGVCQLRRNSGPLEVNSNSVTDLIPSSSVNLDQLIRSVPLLRDINPTHQNFWQLTSELVSVMKTCNQPALNTAESREGMKMSHSLVVPQGNAIVPTADLREPHRLLISVPKDISKIGKPEPSETGINQLPINTIITSRSSHIKQTFKGQTRTDVSRRQQPPTPSHTETVASPGGVNPYIQPAYLPSVHLGSAPTQSQLPLDAFRIYQQYVYPSQSYFQPVVNPMNMPSFGYSLTEQMPVVWTNADMQMYYSRRPERLVKSVNLLLPRCSVR